MSSEFRVLGLEFQRHANSGLETRNLKLGFEINACRKKAKSADRDAAPS